MSVEAAVKATGSGAVDLPRIPVGECPVVEAAPERSGDEEVMLQRARVGTNGGKSRRENRAPAEKGGRAVAVGAWVICGKVTATC